MRIGAALLDRIVEHARRTAPAECCGMVGLRDGEAIAVYELDNTEASPFRFQIEPGELLRTVTAIEAAGDELGVIYHSHTRSEPYPSQTDVQFARDWPGWRWLIVGLAGAQPEVRLYAIEGGEVRELALAP